MFGELYISNLGKSNVYFCRYLLVIVVIITIIIITINIICIITITSTIHTHDINHVFSYNILACLHLN